MYLRTLAIAAAILSVIMTSIGGLMDMYRSGGAITQRHAWHDGTYMALIAIFLLLLSRA